MLGRPRHEKWLGGDNGAETPTGNVPGGRKAYRSPSPRSRFPVARSSPVWTGSRPTTHISDEDQSWPGSGDSTRQETSTALALEPVNSGDKHIVPTLATDAESRGNTTQERGA